MREKYDKESMIKKAKKVLLLSKTGSEIAKEMGMNLNQFYNYRNGFRNIEKAQLETLIKFESYYDDYFKKE